MLDKEFYAALRQYLANRTIKPQLDQYRRKKVMRVAENFVLKDNQLFYTGPSRQYMRLVVMSEEQKLAVLQESHCNPTTGNHNGVRRTRDRVISGYYWSTIKDDVTDWVKSCQSCQLNSSVKTVEQVLHPIKVKEAWEVAGMKIVGPIRETAQKNKYVFTLTDLYTKWVIAEPMQTKCANEVSAVLISKMYLFGMVRKIILDQGKEFVKQLNSRLFRVLNIKNVVSSGCHSQTTEQDERITENIMQTLTKYSNMEHEDWDMHLPAVIYRINTTKHSSTQYSPYYLMFHRHPLTPETINACPMGDTFDVEDPEDELDQRLKDIKAVNIKVLNNLGRTSEQTAAHPDRKQKRITEFTSDVLDEVHIGENSKKCKVDGTLQDRPTSEFNTQVMQIEHSYSLSCISDRHETKVD